MSDLTSFYGPNAGYILELYERYQDDPNSVDQATRELFQNWTPPATVAPSVFGPLPACVLMPEDVERVILAARVTRLVRELGHLDARIDPLGSEPPGDPELELETHGLTTADMERLPPNVVSGPLAEGAVNALDALNRLRRAYSGSVGYETFHIQVPAEREWIRHAVESRRFFQDFTDDEKRAMLCRLTEVETLERFLHQTFIGQKRFSLEGCDMLVPMLDTIIRDAQESGTREVVMGMAHRGRLNVLAHILGKPYPAILSEFVTHKREEMASVSGTGTFGWSGDVKYHLGASRRYGSENTRQMPITLAPNPSHLEFVNPVVVGRARAAQEERSESGLPAQDPHASLAILIHGDGAFPGQGIVAETLNLSQLPGYCVGGTIHIITNNQIGFTTMPREARSTLYASDLAKGFEIPIVHVNADDPIACIAVARMAAEYRDQFGKDFLIDLVGYRRWGHNEGDEPAFTQPRMYESITAHPTVRELWARQLEEEGLIGRDEATEMVRSVRDKLQEAREDKGPVAVKQADSNGNGAGTSVPRVETAVSEVRLVALNEALLQRPPGFTVNARLDRTLVRRRTAIHEPGGIDWGHAEALAFASILEDGIPIRMTGQDSERGTFSHRHLVLHDPVTGDLHTPMQALPQARASFAVYNSPLSENAVLGFEYGYSMHARGALVLWEAQFGDFSNSAQVIIDQFLVSGKAKWRQAPSMVLLLPHGYEGQGPEHSSARLERFLQLAAEDNIRVVNCTNSAQYFHLLRRQAALLDHDPLPLIVMTPKSLLRHPRAGSSLEDLTHGAFFPLVDDPNAQDRADEVTRVILCSGKVYVDLLAEEELARADRVAVVRMTQLYPFPRREMEAIFARYPAMREVVWLQEEPQNMGAWTFVQPYLADMLGKSHRLTYVGRDPMASTAEGSALRHAMTQSRILAKALDDVPELKTKRSSVTHAR